MRIVLEDEEINDIGHALGMFLVFDSDGIIVYSSDEAKDKFLYGEDIIGIDVRKLFPGFMNGVDNYEELDKLLKDEQEINAYRKNGTCFPVELKMGSIDGRYAFRIVDLTKELEWKQRYERAEIDTKSVLAKQNEFVANVTHELKTPVNGIKGNIIYLKEQGGLTKAQEETLDIVS